MRIIAPLLSMCSYFPLNNFGTLTERGARFALLVRIVASLVGNLSS